MKCLVNLAIFLVELAIIYNYPQRTYDYLGADTESSFKLQGGVRVAGTRDLDGTPNGRSPAWFEVPSSRFCLAEHS
ncbi:hypothetical protein SAMN06296036_1382 [Pseudobacteriovorax antillogorgiicola]|uniref:Uncharacterized protein n=1 Tax=Pseudobacteriovorax antillogorgiicola TaxID=1513793 RepID=A0A1Y6CQR6_9BACT|nr:hypothetical protein EDD56_1393 [Pseudobacteriovorax antillogorgiicola]SMF81779.1 hypothetical protein SAMN06296036_1382 [Pseudobacteriovorax antillogorgiicola]